MADPPAPLIKMNSSLLVLFSLQTEMLVPPQTQQQADVHERLPKPELQQKPNQKNPRVCLLFHLCCLLCLSCLLARRHFMWILPSSGLGRVLLTHFNWQEVETQKWKLQNERRKEGRKDGRKDVTSLLLLSFPTVCWFSVNIFTALLITRSSGTTSLTSLCSPWDQIFIRSVVISVYTPFASLPFG